VGCNVVVQESDEIRVRFTTDGGDEAWEAGMPTEQGTYDPNFNEQLRQAYPFEIWRSSPAGMVESKYTGFTLVYDSEAASTNSGDASVVEHAGCPAAVTHLTEKAGNFGISSDYIPPSYTETWFISPPGAQSIALDFTGLHTDDGFHSVKVSSCPGGSSSSCTLVANFSGKLKPCDFIHNTDTLKVEFVSSPFSWYNQSFLSPFRGFGNPDWALPADPILGISYTSYTRPSSYEASGQCSSVQAVLTDEAMPSAGQSLSEYWDPWLSLTCWEEALFDSVTPRVCMLKMNAGMYGSAGKAEWVIRPSNAKSISINVELQLEQVLSIFPPCKIHHALRSVD
jgi:hypothetical protein